MWWKGFLVVHLVGLRNIISSQPVIGNGKIHDTRQMKYRECCPCPEFNDGLKDQNLLPSQTSSLLHTPINECRRFTGSDSEGSSSIFYPSFLRGAQSNEREQVLKQEPKPLLRPEVGLASSVLETLKEATDEEYKEALARDATRTMLNAAEPNPLDAEHGATRNSVTIVINPRDLENSYDAIPEASHTHETRCIHNPLRSSKLASNRRLALPRLSKQYQVLPKMKLKSPLHKSLVDMDNSPSNMEENFDVQIKNDHGRKLKINPLLLSDLSKKVGEPVDTLHHSDTQLRKILTEQCDFNTRRELMNSPVLTLANLRNKLRDLTEVKNAEHMNNVFKAGINQNKLKTSERNEHDDIALKLPILKLPTFDTVYDKQSPLVKNILKLRDVELIPPRKISIKDKPRIYNNFSDLKSAGTESKAAVILSEANNDQKSNECLTINSSTSDEYMSEDSKEIEPNPISDIDVSSTVQTVVQEETEMKPLDTSSTQIIESVCNETDILDSSEEEDIINNNSINTDFVNQNIKKDDQYDELTDSTPESSIIITQTTSDEQGSVQNDYLATEARKKNEEICDEERISITNSGVLTNIDAKNNNPSLSVPHESSRRILLKDDLLRTLKNLRNTINSKLDDNNFDSSQEMQLEQTQFAVANISNSYPISEKVVTTQDLQKMSNSLLIQENSPIAKATILKETECNTDVDDVSRSHKNNETSTYDVQNNKSTFDLYQTESQPDESGILSENFRNGNYEDVLSTTINSSIQQDVDDSQRSKFTCDTISDEIYDITDGDVTANNEMSSQASSLNFDALRPQFSNNQLQFPLPQDVEVEPSFLSDEKDLKKPFKIPSLEEIRQRITSIIDAGQREEGIESDTEPLYESSNINSVQSLNTNLRSKPGQLKSLNVGRNSLIPSLHPDSYKNRPSSTHIESSSPLKLESILSNHANKLSPLALGNDKTISAMKSKSAFNNFGNPIKEGPSLDTIRDIFKSNTKNSFKKVPFQLPITYEAESPHFAGRSSNLLNNGLNTYTDNLDTKIKNRFKDKTVNNHRILSQSKANSDDIFETIARKRDDMKEKLQALHVDFNDRLATIHDRLLDQTNLQSINIPSYKDGSNKIKLPVIASEKERNLYKPFSERLTDKKPDLLLKSPLLPKENYEANSQKSWVPKNSQVFYTPTGKDGAKYTMKHTTDFLKNKNPADVKKLSNTQKINKIEELGKNLDKQRGLTSLRNGNIKISFSTTTIKPIMNQRRIAHNHDKKYPPNVFTPKNNNEMLLNAYRKKLKNAGDSNHSPSELVPARIQSLKESSNSDNLIKIWQSELDINPAPLTQKQAIPKNEVDAKMKPSAPSVTPSTKGSTLIANMREALRSKLANINKSAFITSPKNELDLKSISDAVQSPSEKVNKIEIVNDPLKENTSYKCTMMCIKDL